MFCFTVVVRLLLSLFEPLCQSVLFLFSQPLPSFSPLSETTMKYNDQVLQTVSCPCLQHCDISSFHSFSYCVKHCLSLYLLHPFPFIIHCCLSNASFPNAFASCPNLLLFSTKLLYRFTFSFLHPSFSEIGMLNFTF